MPKHYIWYIYVKKEELNQASSNFVVNVRLGSRKENHRMREMVSILVLSVMHMDFFCTDKPGFKAKVSVKDEEIIQKRSYR